MAIEMKICKYCETEKTLDLFVCRDGKYRPMCKACSNQRKRVAEKVVKLAVPVQQVTQYTYTKYVPKAVWVRNEGLKHIPSRGFPC